LKRIIFLLAITLMSANLAAADLKGLSCVGIRLGVGHTVQDEPDQRYSNYEISADANGFYSEAFFNWHFLNEVALEIAQAALTRGEFRWNVEDGNFFGNINLYPIMFGIKLKPLASQLSQYYQPFVGGGGSIIVGRAVIEGGTVFDPYVYIDRSAESETALGWWLSGGFESFVSSTICITSQFRYQHMKFDKPVGGYIDHSGYQITFGVAYIFRKPK